MAEVPRHRSRAELEAALPQIAGAPKDSATVELIVVRPDHGQRETPGAVRLSRDFGVEGDHWSKGCWLQTDDGRPHPDVQLNLMGVRAATAIAGAADNWTGAGNNIFADIDMSPANLPPGTRLGLGTAEIEITAQANRGCGTFIESYGRDACVFVNVGPGWALRMRGLYARIVRNGEVRLGDRLWKL